MSQATKGNSSTAAATAAERFQDPITAEEIDGTSIPQATRTPTLPKRGNAFTELMSAKKPKPTAQPAEKPAKPSQRSFDARNGLGLYIEKPEANPEGLVVEYDDDFVVINDKFPKASNPTFLAKIRKRVEQLKILAASELRRKYGRHSAADAPYQTALEDLMSSADLPPLEARDALLPPGRDWLAEIKAGAHTHPSMNHMHIHVMSRDMHSPCMKHKKHYLSFNSSFFVPVEDFPLEEGSARFHPGDWPSWDMKCWRCGKNFKNKFAALKKHLEEEFEEWKKE
ncbi:aprataxin-like protein [Neodidymelliopsis sp. IMI 364377]|nr:aprataxin-like protein [Neodidymelliopsis sp. IMI 364377]